MATATALVFNIIARDKASRTIKGFAGTTARAGQALTKGLTLPLIAAGTAAFKVADDYSKAQATIRTGTGATGKALKGLTKDFKRVNAIVPNATGDVATAIADLNTRTGASGKTLQGLSRQMLNLSRITGSDVGPLIASTTRVFGDWSIKTKDQGRALDFLFKTSQSTGIGVDELAQKVVQFGAPLRQMGFSFEQSAAMMGKWEKEGVNTTLALSGMKIALGNFAKAGKDPQQAMKRLSERIKDAGSKAEANKIAVKAFGQRAGPDMAAAIREGRFSIDGLLNQLKKSPETINKAANASLTLSDKLSLLRKRAETVLMNVIDWFEGLSPAMQKVVIGAAAFVAGLGPALGVAGKLAFGIKAMSFAAAASQGPLSILAFGIKAVGKAILTNPIGLIITAIVALGAALVVAYQKSETFRNFVQAAWNGIKTVISAVWNGFLKPIFAAMMDVFQKDIMPTVRVLWKEIFEPAFRAIGKVIAWAWNSVIKPALRLLWLFIKNVLVPVIVWLWKTIIAPAFKAIGQVIAWAWTNIVRPALAAFRSFIKNVLAPGIRWLWKNVIVPAWNGIKLAISVAWNKVIKPVFNSLKTFITKTIPAGFRTGVAAIKKVWDTVKRIAKAPVSFVVNTVWNNGLRKVWNLVAGIVGMKKLAPVKGFASGGILPGYSRKDNQIIMARSGEGILTPEAVRSLGPDFIHRANAAGRRAGDAVFGGDPSSVRIPGYAEGGIVGVIKSAIGKGVDIFKNLPKTILNNGILSWVKKLLNPLLSLIPKGAGDWIAAVGKLPGKMIAGFIDWIKKKIAPLLESAGGGPIGGGGFARALTFAKAQRGKPYRWGGVGPGGYDCSGFMSAITNVIQGKRPYARRFTTHSFGASAPAGFVRNRMSPFRVGVTHAGVGHMAGTLNGVAVESSGGAGVRVGGSARSATNRLFSSRYGLRGGKADNGAILEPGWNPPLYNGTHKPENLIPREQAERMGPREVHIHVDNHGVISSPREAEDFLARALDNLRRKGRLSLASR